MTGPDLAMWVIAVAGTLGGVLVGWWVAVGAPLPNLRTRRSSR